MAFKFIHIADVHLDTPFKSSDAKLRSYLRDSIRQAFKSSVDIALAKSVHAVLIAGDLFDNDTLSFQSEKFLIQQIDKLNDAKIKVFYAPGNHDPYKSAYRMQQIFWPGNFHIFGTSEPEIIPILDESGNKIAVIAGAGHEGKREPNNLAQRFPCASSEVPYIGLLHTFINESKGATKHDRYAPCSLSDLSQKGYIYWALGHVHTRETVSREPLIVYPGNLVGRNTSETGPKGVHYVEIDDARNIKSEFCPVSPVCWETVEVDDLTDAVNWESLEQKIYRRTALKIESINFSGELILNILLKGPCPIYGDLAKTDNMEDLSDSIKSSLNIEFLSITPYNVTRPVDIASFKGEPHILGAVLNILDRLNMDDELLLRLFPDEPAGYRIATGRSDKMKYLRSLLDGLDYEAAARLLKERAIDAD